MRILVRALSYAALAWSVSGVSPTSNPVETCGGSNAYTFRIVNQPADSVYVAELGVDPQIRIFCVSMVETPTYSTSCSTRSLPVLCRDRIDVDSACEALAEYAYETWHEITRGSADGNAVRWILKWDPRSKSSACYPRDISIYVNFQTEHPEGRSLVLAVGAIICVSMLFIALCAFGLSRVLDRTKQQREAKRKATFERGGWSGNAGGQQVATDPSRMEPGSEALVCPSCGIPQVRYGRGVGSDPYLELKCRDCGRTNAGWQLVELFEAEPQELVVFDANGEKVRVPRELPAGISTAEIASNNDTALRVAVATAMHNPYTTVIPGGTQPNPLYTNFPISPAPAAVPPPRQWSPVLQAVGARRESSPFQVHYENDPVFNPRRQPEYMS
ncbi:hypothetical protein DIPPA_02393 [Diplonema papillatum]|nr:hypothetical protein DIPPA_02393 [Diplonema papillatum]|eukprot:gene4732-7273_t